MGTYTSEVTLTSLVCGRCGITFAVPEQWRKKKVEEHANFSCPNGCSRRFIAETEAERLSRELQAKTNEANQLREHWFAEQRKLEAAERKAKSLKRRVSRGVCPCCKRTVSQLGRHMESKHPEFVEENKQTA